MALSQLFWDVLLLLNPKWPYLFIYLFIYLKIVYFLSLNIAFVFYLLFTTFFEIGVVSWKTNYTSSLNSINNCVLFHP